ncbi:MAG TPA: alpha-L-fucosidase [Candidatus Sulfotelmatobacter sp.]|nr:alpha-L-fucosidase [Candidatus Sulfotelmatobacter sp.]
MRFFLGVPQAALAARLWLVSLILLISAPGPAQTRDANAPTAALSPEEIDQIWQKASAKYDDARSAILRRVDAANATGQFRPDWESLQHYQVPDWYKDAKFGIFIHWGVYSVPAFGSEWYPRLMYSPGTPEYKHHIATYGPQDKFGYKDFIPRFKAERFDPAAWARLFKDAGAKYVVPVFEHHDGFPMYDCGLSDWTALKMGPKRDLLGDLAKAVRAEGLHLGASSHRVEHNFFLDQGRTFPSDVNDPQYAAFYGPAHHWMENRHGTPLSNDFTFVSQAWTRDWLARSAEIVEKYRPEIMYFDWWDGQPSVRPDLNRFAAFYYNTVQANGKPTGVINYKDFAMQENSAVLDIERGQLSGIRQLYWQTDTSVSNRSWGYIENDTFKTPEFVVHQLVDIVSKNGNLLLNIGPRSDGTIPDEVQQVLRAVGAWLKVNGEAIYGTRSWRIFGEGPTKVQEGAFHDTDTQSYTPQDIRFTTRDGNLYAIELGWPENHELLIHSLPSGVAGEGKVASVQLLGAKRTLSFQQTPDGLRISLPEKPERQYAYVFRIGFTPQP